MAELEKLQVELQEAVRESEKLKVKTLLWCVFSGCNRRVKPGLVQHIPQLWGHSIGMHLLSSQSFNYISFSKHCQSHVFTAKALLVLISFHHHQYVIFQSSLHFLQMDLRNIPEEVVKETLEYKCLQSQFSLLYNESLGVKTQLDEARALLLTTKNAHLRQIEHMEVKLSSCSSQFNLKSVLFM